MHAEFTEICTNDRSIFSTSPHSCMPFPALIFCEAPTLKLSYSFSLGRSFDLFFFFFFFPPTNHSSFFSLVLLTVRCLIIIFPAVHIATDNNSFTSLHLVFWL